MPTLSVDNKDCISNVQWSDNNTTVKTKWKATTFINLLSKSSGNAKVDRMWWFEVAREREKRNENRKKLKRRRTRGWKYTINRHKRRDRDNRILSHPPRHRHRHRQRRRHKHSKSQKMKNQMLNTLKRNNDCFRFVWKVCLLLYNLFAVCAHYARSPLYKLFYRKTFSFSSEYRVRYGTAKSRHRIF